MNHPDYDGAVAYALSRLEQELPPELLYHGVEHTFDHVLPAITRLAEAYDLEQQEKDLLRVAAAFHDIGWIEGGENHEEKGVRIVREVLPSFGFQKDQIDCIAAIIGATGIPQSPHSLLEQIMADADLDILGRDDFWKRNQDLRTERSINGHPMSDQEWLTSQLDFIESHNYFTEAARQLRDEGKKTHINEIKHRLEQARSELSH